MNSEETAADYVEIQLVSIKYSIALCNAQIN